MEAPVGERTEEEEEEEEEVDVSTAIHNSRSADDLDLIFDRHRKFDIGTLLKIGQSRAWPGRQ